MPGRCPFLTLGILLGAVTGLAGQNPGDPFEFQRFLAWFPGEYDNHEQVWQEEIDGVDHPHERVHHLFAPVAYPALGEHVFYVKQTDGEDPSQLYRERLYLFEPDALEGAIRLTIFTLPEGIGVLDAHLDPEVLATLDPESLSSVPGCEVWWSFNGESFDGYMREDACTFLSRRSGEWILVNDELRLSDNEIWIRDAARDQEGNRVYGHPLGIPHKNRKVRYFTGWAAVKKAGRLATAGDEEWHYIPGLLLHDEGTFLSLRTQEGEALGIEVELARLTYQETGVAILKLGIREESTGETISYSWTEPKGERIGLNLGWLQVGLAIKEEAPHFGFTPGGPDR